MFKVKYLEPFLNERISAAQKSAERIHFLLKNTTEIKDIEEFEDLLRFILGRHFNIPTYDKSFDDLTIDQMVREVHLITESEKTFSPKETSKVIKDNPDEIKKLGDEMEKFFDVTSQFNSQNQPDNFDELSKSFMETGEWHQEGAKND